MSKSKLITQLQQYSSSYPEEMTFKTRFLALLTSYDNCFERMLLHGHITGSSWIVDNTKQYALLTHHTKLDKWLQLGGHADGNSNISAVAYKEAMEESGLKNIKLINTAIFDIDIHSIPKKGDEPKHLHYDIRYLFEADKSENLQFNHESKAMKWVNLSEISSLVQGNMSIMRMANKAAIKIVK